MNADLNKSMKKMKSLLPLTVLALVAGLSACGGDSPPADTQKTTDAPSAAPAETSATAAAPATVTETGAVATTDAATAISVDNPRIRVTPPGLMVTGAFMTLKNNADTPYALVAASSDIAAVTEIHQTQMQGEVMQMQQVEKIEVAAGEKTELRPGGFHIMLMQLKKPVAAGDKIPITLIFSDHSQKTVEAVAADDMQ